MALPKASDLPRRIVRYPGVGDEKNGNKKWKEGLTFYALMIE